MNIEGLSLRPLVAELDARLAGARVDKIFQPDKFRLVVWLRQPGENIPLLLSANPDAACAWLPAALPENPAVPPAFCMLLRKHLEDGRVARVAQHGLDRVVTIAVDVRGEGGLIITKELILEIMGKHSNIILVQDGLVLDAIRRVGAAVSRVRQVLPGRPYALPPGRPRADLLAADPAAVIAAVRTQPGPLAKAIVAAAEGIGPLTAREIAWRAGLSADLPAPSLDDADAGALGEAVASIAEPLVAGTLSPTVALSADGGKILALAAFRPEHLAGSDLRPFPSMCDAVEFAAGFRGQTATPEKSLLQKIVGGETARLARKKTVLAAELAEAGEADTLRKYADILMAHLHAVPARSNHATLPDLFTPDARPIAIPLDPLLTPLANARRYYTKYNKAKRAQETIAAQLAECRGEIAYLDTVALSLDQAAAGDLGEIRAELVQAGYIKERGKRRPPSPASLLTAAAPDGTPILIGKNNRQNDLVTFKHAHPDDLWLHTKDIPGSHVILKTGGRLPADETLAAAAMLAAWFSKARASATVPVDYTRRRYVKKPAGAKPGFVIYERQKTLYVTPDETAVKELLEKNP